MTSGGHYFPKRGSEIEAWIKAWRDRYERGPGPWEGFDDLLDDYRLHADCGVAICHDVHEGDVDG